MNRESDHNFSVEAGGGEYTLSLKDLFQSLWRRLWIVVLVVLLFVGAAIGVSLLQTPQYEASIDILVGQNQSFTDSPTEAMGMQELTPTLAAAVSSQRVAGAVIESLDLQTNSEDFLRKMNVEQLPNTQLVRVTYEDPSPEEAQRIANAIGEEFSEQISEAGPEESAITATVWDEASLPDESSSPNPLRNGVLALLAGLVAGIGLALLLEFLDDSWHSPEEAEKISGVPTFGVIPQFKPGGSLEKPRKRRKKRTKGAYYTRGSYTTSRKTRSESLSTNYQEITRNEQISWPIGVALMDSSEKVIEANEALTQMLGYSREELEGSNLAEFSTHPDDVENNKDLQKKLLSGEEKSCQVEKRFIKKDGQILWVRLTSSVVKSSEQSGEKLLLSMVEDITRGKHTEEELRLSNEARRVSEARLEAVVEGAPLAIQSFTPDGYAITRSEVWNEILKQDFKQSSGGYNLLEDEDAVSSGLAAYFKERAENDGSNGTPDLSFGTQNGDGRWFKAFAEPVRDDSGRVLEVALILEEITSGKRIEDLERALEESEARRKKAEKDLSASRERFKSLIQFAVGGRDPGKDKNGGDKE